MIINYVVSRNIGNLFFVTLNISNIMLSNNNYFFFLAREIIKYVHNNKKNVIFYAIIKNNFG